MKKKKKRWLSSPYIKAAVIIIMVFIANLCSNAVYLKNLGKEEVEIKIEVNVIIPEELEESKDIFSEDILIDYLKDINIKFPEIVLAQAKLETGNFKSKIFLTNNNMFGMKKSYSRPSSSLKDSLGYAYFENWRLSVLDYALYQSHFLRKYDSREKYLERLGRTYAEDEGYIQKIKQIILETEENFY